MLRYSKLVGLLNDHVTCKQKEKEVMCYIANFLDILPGSWHSNRDLEQNSWTNHEIITSLEDSCL